MAIVLEWLRIGGWPAHSVLLTDEGRQAARAASRVALKPHIWSCRHCQLNIL